MLNVSIKKTNQLRKWRTLFNLTVLSACFYASMEWLFFVTKPSSLSILPTFDAGEVLFVTAGIIALIFLAVLACFTLPALLIHHPAWHIRLLTLGRVVPAAILSITALIMLDNFTYTVFKFGIVSMTGFRRGLYMLGFLFFFWRILLFTKQATWARRRFASYLALGLLTVSMIVVLATRLSNALDLNPAAPRSTVSSEDYPNIIILGGDGLNASDLTVYGSRLPTTPFLSQLAKTSLVAENAFPNAGSTTASTTSVLTGKEPIADKVYHYPDILAGRDSFEHLPGILRQHGYKTIEVGTPYYVDAQRLNMLEGFDIVNNKSLDTPGSGALRTLLGNSPSTYFIQTIAERASERLLHIFFIKKMQNPLAEVYSPVARISDEQRVNQIIDQLDDSEGPLFVFAHLMDTHGPQFSFRRQVFSIGSNSDQDWDKSRYLDAVLSFDDHVKRIYEHLAETGELDNTILVIYTDHGFKYATHERIPIIIHFPENAYTGIRRNNVQVIDIPVTLLDYLGISTPEWMNGTSLLNSEMPADREIMTTTAGSPKKIKPPFYQINTMQVIVCHKWYELNVRQNTFDSGTILGHTAKCQEDLLPSDERMRQRILVYLKQHGYDVSSLER